MGVPSGRAPPCLRGHFGGTGHSWVRFSQARQRMERKPCLVMPTQFPSTILCFPDPPKGQGGGAASLLVLRCAASVNFIFLSKVQSHFSNMAWGRGRFWQEKIRPDLLISGSLKARQRPLLSSTCLSFLQVTPVSQAICKPGLDIAFGMLQTLLDTRLGNGGAKAAWLLPLPKFSESRTC